MKRKIILFVATFIIILLAFCTYQMFVPGIPMFDPGSHIRKPEFTSYRHGDEMNVGNITEFYYTDMTPDGRKRGIYSAQSWTQDDDGSFRLVKPAAILHHKDGSRTYMTADRGWIDAEQVAKGISVRRGRFEGNVEIYVDQSKALDPPHPAQRSASDILEQCIRIRIDYVDFSQELLEIRTDSEVYLWSKTVDLVGKGMVISWNDSPRELRLLKINEGDIMIVKELPEQMNMVQLPTEGKAQKIKRQKAQQEQEKKLAAEPKPKPIVEAKPLIKPIVAAPTAPEDLMDEDIGIELIDESELQQETDTEIVIAATKTREARNIYQAVFNSNVRIFSGRRKLVGAALLTLQFEWDRAWRQGSGDDDKKKKSQAPASESEQLAKADAVTKPASKPADKSKVAAKPKTDNWMEIFWDGTLEIRPVGKTDTPDRRRCTIAGEGRNVLLADEEAQIVCKKFEFQNPQQSASFEGAKGFPVRIMLSQGDELECRGKVRFVREQGKAYFDGSGVINRYSKAGEAGKVSDVDYMLMPHLPAEASDLTEQIAWAGGLTASFDELKQVKDGKKKIRPFLRTADFRKSVKLKQFNDTGVVTNYVNCAALNVQMKTSESGKAYPYKVTARGDVRAYQDGSAVASQYVQMFFRPAKKTDETKKKSKDSMAIAGMGSSRVEPIYIRCRGGVDITYVDPKKPNEPPMRIVADTITSDMVRRIGVLTGRPARVWQGTDSIDGAIIRFDNENQKQAVRVDGKGTLAFLSKQGLGGGKTRVPRHVKVNWDKEMLYHGKDGVAYFEGDVDIHSGGDIMQSNQMKLIFIKKPDPEKLAHATAGKTEKAPFGMKLDSYSKQEFASIEAAGGYGKKKLALMRTTTFSELNSSWVERRVELRGAKIFYNALTERATVDGTGSFFAEDYRMPEKTKKTASIDNPSSVVDRPSQTAIVWFKSMELDMKARHAKVEGKVQMGHRSGRNVNPKRTKIPPLGELTTGRIATLRAEDLDVWFEEGKDKDKKSAKSGDMFAQAGSGFGPVSRFVANKDVTFSDSKGAADSNSIKVDADRVEYDYLSSGGDVLKRMLTVYGERRRDKITNAQINIEDAVSGRIQKFVAPKFTYDLLNDKFKAEKLRGAGGF